MKKPASKEKRRGEENEFSYKELAPVNPQEVSSRAMNALEHLGSQRFGMPPYSEHFRRWMLDIDSVLNDFRRLLPDATNENFDKCVTQLAANVRTELDGRIRAEETLSTKVRELQAQLADNERDMAELESEQRIKMHDVKRASDKSMKKLRGEIDALDAQRLRLLRQKPTFLDRILGNAKVRVENSSRSLHSKRTDLESREESLKRHMSVLRNSYEEKRRPLAAQQAKLREELAKLRASTLDDAVEVRETACEQLGQIISSAVAQLTPRKSQESLQ
jgi:outer membrane murein-binding lipoprotein Lpp